ncbi:MAG: agmatine deiminase family protein [Bacteroidetes bacterium]|nr:agmatine deiminase family protein [Bacteroidota bacterium]
MSPAERDAMPAYIQSRNSSSSLLSTPPSSPVRTIGEWEELQGFTITWTSYQSMLKEIVRYAKLETRVYIVCSNPATVISYLASNNIDTVNVTCLQLPFNSVWSRDYGPWSAYTNEVDTLLTIDWIYNRPRPLDDALPALIAAQLNTPFYETTTSPWDLIHTGGNFMTDGFGTGFSSKLILDENPSKTEAQIDTIMSRFMGINRYIKMDKLPYDVIHHIDMHMKLLDEETILFGEYPAGVADGPQIEANLLYVLNNYNSVFGTPYKIVRIPMPPDNGQYPNTNGDYFTYTNSSFINKTIIVPTYNIPQDTTALRIYRDELPGYNVVGINSTASIGALGALHCITKELGTSDPLLISHQPLPDTYDDVNPYFVNAFMKHRSGISNATMYYRTDTLLPYVAVSMTSLSSQIDHWGANIPAHPVGTIIYYYVEAESNSGKQQVRPISAPAGYWEFEVLGPTGLGEDLTTFELQSVFPNPSKGITCIPLISNEKQKINIKLFDILGKHVETIFDGFAAVGENRYFLNTQNVPSGLYFIEVYSALGSKREKLVVR